MENFRTKEEFEGVKARWRKLLAATLYGEMPPRPKHLSVKITSVEPRYLGGKATLTRFLLIADMGEGDVSFIASSVVPNTEGKRPTFIHLGEEGHSATLPIEEIVDEGFALFMAEASDVTEDNEDIKDGVGRWLTKGRWKTARPGKLMLWAWAMLRLLDYALSCDSVDGGRVAAVGHSRLAISALLAGGSDERFAYIISNSAGIGGDSATVGDGSAEMRRLISLKPTRYTKGAAENRSEYATASQLLALSVPRKIMIGGAMDDALCEPRRQLAALEELSGIYELYGKAGIPEVRVSEAPYHIYNSSVSMHARRGGHFLSREDWRIFMDYIKRDNT